MMCGSSTEPWAFWFASASAWLAAVGVDWAALPVTRAEWAAMHADGLTPADAALAAWTEGEMGLEELNKKGG